jgi:hypothetical protein
VARVDGSPTKFGKNGDVRHAGGGWIGGKYEELVPESIKQELAVLGTGANYALVIEGVGAGAKIVVKKLPSAIDDVVKAAIKNVDYGAGAAGAVLPKNPTTGVAPGTRVLGKNPYYLDFAEEVGGKRFQIPDEIWNKMSPDARWMANQKFLDRGVALGEPFALSNKVTDIGSVTGYYGKELRYLQSKGYVLNPEGTMMIKGK